MQDIDYVYEVYKERSFSAAAKNLFISQPALSAAVKRTEEALGIMIFDRSTSPIRLTEEGRVYIESVERIRIVEEEMKNRLSDMGELRRGHITVSGENFVSSFIMPRVILAFADKYPGIAVELVESNSPDLRQQLLSESIDLLIAHDFDERSYVSEPLFEETILLAVPAAFPINEKLSAFALDRADIEQGRHLSPDCPHVELSAFADETFLLLKKGNDMCRRAAVLFDEAGIRPKVKITLDQLITSYNMVCAGLGVAFVTDMVVKSSRAEGCRFYLPSSAHIHRQMCIGYKRNRYLPHAVAAFYETAKEVYRGETGEAKGTKGTKGTLLS